MNLNFTTFQYDFPFYKLQTLKSSHVYLFPPIYITDSHLQPPIMSLSLKSYLKIQLRGVFITKTTRMKMQA